MPNEFPYDVFLRHSAKDKVVVRSSSLSASIPFSASDSPRCRAVAAGGEKVAEGRMRCRQESGERAGVRCRSFHLAERLRADRLNRLPPELQPSAFSLQPSAFSLPPSLDAPVKGSLAQSLCISEGGP